MTRDLNSCSSASTVVTGWRQVKLRHTYAAVVPSDRLHRRDERQAAGAERAADARVTRS